MSVGRAVFDQKTCNLSTAVAVLQLLSHFQDQDLKSFFTTLFEVLVPPLK
jgi:hypothetical protein